MAVVVADCVGGGDEDEPAGVEEGIEPDVVLAGDGDGPGDLERHREALADGFVEERPEAAEVGAAEGRKAVLEELVELVELRDGPRRELASLARSVARAAARAPLVFSRGGHGPRV